MQDSHVSSMLVCSYNNPIVWKSGFFKKKLCLSVVSQSVRQRCDGLEPTGKSLTSKREWLCRVTSSYVNVILPVVYQGPYSSDRICHGGCEARFCHRRTQVQNPRSPGCTEGTVIQCLPVEVAAPNCIKITVWDKPFIGYDDKRFSCFLAESSVGTGRPPEEDPPCRQPHRHLHRRTDCWRQAAVVGHGCPHSEARHTDWS